MKYLTILFYAAIISSCFGSVKASEIRLRMPDDADTYLLLDSSGNAKFSGKVQLQGQLLVVSRRKMIDDDVEWHVALLFQPDPEEHKKLPYIRYADETDKKDQLFIELNSFHKEHFIKIIEDIFGAEIAANTGKSAFEIGKRGSLSLNSYSTNVECDQRYHYAYFVSFESQQDMPAEQAHLLVKQMYGSSCF